MPGRCNTAGEAQLPPARSLTPAPWDLQGAGPSAADMMPAPSWAGPPVPWPSYQQQQQQQYYGQYGQPVCGGVGMGMLAPWGGLPLQHQGAAAAAGAHGVAGIGAGPGMQPLQHQEAEEQARDWGNWRDEEDAKEPMVLKVKV